MYPHTEDATGDRRQVDVDERHPDRARDDQPDYEVQQDEARRAEQYGDAPANQPDYAAGETADPNRTAEYGEPPAGQEEYAEPGERGQAPEYAEPAYRHDQPGGPTGYAEPDRAERPAGDLPDEPSAVTDETADQTSADRPAGEAVTGTHADQEPTQRAPQPTDGWQLFTTEDSDNLRSRWIELQGSFVDDPRQAVERAEQLVSEVVQTVTDRFDERRNELATQSADTEELRLAMHRYRAFFRQLLGG